MKGKLSFKICVDIGMTIALMLLMAFELVGRAAHEWIGMGMFILLVAHHALNRSWWKNLTKGKYTAYRILQTALVILVLLAMAGSMISGVIISREVFDFLSIRAGYEFARTLHMISAYWGFVLMSLHLGLHWSMMMGIIKKHIPQASAVWTWVLHGAAALIAVYGGYAFFKREIGSYMLLKSHFVFFDFGEPILFFFLDYLAVMGLFVWIDYYLSRAVRRAGKSPKGGK